MTRRRARRLLWILALCLLPVPFYLGQAELAPVLRLAFLSGLLGAVWLEEGGDTLRLILLIGATQILLHGGLLWILAWGVSRAIDALRTPAARTAITLALASLLLLASFTELYKTPLSSTRPRSNVLHLFE